LNTRRVSRSLAPVILVCVLSLATVACAGQSIDVSVTFERQPTEWFDPARPPADVSASGGTALCRIRYEMEFSSGPITTAPEPRANGAWHVRYELAEAAIRLVVRTQEVLPIGASDVTGVHEQGHALIAEAIGRSLAPPAIRDAFTGVAGEGTGATVAEADRLASDAFNVSVQDSMQRAGDELDDWSFYYNDLDYHARLSILEWPDVVSVRATAEAVADDVETEGIELLSCLGIIARQIAEAGFSSSSASSAPAVLPDSGAGILFENELPSIALGLNGLTSVERHCALSLATKGEASSPAGRETLASILWRRWASLSKG